MREHAGSRPRFLMPARGVLAVYSKPEALARDRAANYSDPGFVFSPSTPRKNPSLTLRVVKAQKNRSLTLSLARFAGANKLFGAELRIAVGVETLESLVGIFLLGEPSFELFEGEPTIVVGISSFKDRGTILARLRGLRSR